MSTQFVIIIISVKQVRTENNEDELLFFRVAEGIFVGYFTLEYLIRYLVSPQKADFFYITATFSQSNILDLLHNFFPQYH